MKAQVFVQVENRKGVMGRMNPASLLIPAEFVDVYEKGVAEMDGSVRRYFQSLLWKYRPLFYNGCLPSSDGERFTREYQGRFKEGRKKVTFRPNPEEWGEMTNVALAHGLSLCNFFVLLLRLESVGCGEDDKVAMLWVGVPTTLFVNSTLTQQIRGAEKVYERQYRQTQYLHPALSPEVTYYWSEFG